MKVTPAKVTGILLILLVVLAAGGIGALYFTSDLEAVFVSCVATDPLNAQPQFDTLKKQLENGTYAGTRFSEETIGNADEYVFYTWTAEIRNSTALKADIIELQVIPTDGDIVQLNGDMTRLGDQQLYQADPHGTCTISVTVLAKRDTRNINKGKVTWYMWGLPFHQDIDLYQK